MTCLVLAITLPHLDYCNVLIAKLPKSTLVHLQNLVINLNLKDHTTAALHTLYWLPLHQKIVHIALNQGVQNYVSACLTAVAVFTTEHHKALP